MKCKSKYGHFCTKIFQAANSSKTHPVHSLTLLRRHNERYGVSNHQPHHCLVKRLFRHRSKKTSKLRVTGLCAGNSPLTGEFPHKSPVTRKMFPFDDAIMTCMLLLLCVCQASMEIRQRLQGSAWTPAVGYTWDLYVTGHRSYAKGWPGESITRQIMCCPHKSARLKLMYFLEVRSVG